MDLNICIENCGVRDSDALINEKLDRCKQLGFHTIALSVCVDITSPKPKQQQQLNIPMPPDKSLYTTRNMKVYTRLTVKVQETIQLFKLSKSPEASKYDLLALEPQNAKILQYIATGSTELDILTFNLSERLDFSLFKVRFKILEERGVCIEINYGPAQLGSSLRRNIICNGQNLIEKTHKNVILSSGVEDIFRLRGPKDAVSLGVLFMIPPKRCYNTVYKNGKKALDLAKHRANPISSAIELIKSE